MPRRPALAGLLRAIPAELGEEDWPDRVLHELAGLHLLSRAHARIEELPATSPPPCAAGSATRWPRPTCWRGPGSFDSWWAVGAVDVVDDHLRRRRVWLRGAVSRRWAVWLTFAPTGPVLRRLRPSRTGHRRGAALLSRRGPAPCAGGPSERRVDPRTTDGQRESTGRCAPPVRRARGRGSLGEPDAGGGLRTAGSCDDGGWWLVDAAGAGCRLVGLAGQPWPLLAQSAGESLTVFGEWNGFGLCRSACCPMIAVGS